MSTFTFVHAADIHLDSPLLNLDRYDGAPVEEFRGATRRAFANLVELAVEEEARFVLIAGDLYDGDCRDFNTPRMLRGMFKELGEAGIDVYIVLGNHDAQSRMKKAFALKLPENVHIFPSKKPATFEISDLQAAIHGQSFATESVTEDLSAGYPLPKRGWLNIGLLHTNCGARADHDNYAPSIVDGLAAKGYDYWALGHIHAREILGRGDPWIVYPGNIQGRHVRESGPKGCTLVCVEDGSIVDVTHRDLDAVRWAVCKVDAGACRNPQQAIDVAESMIERQLSEAEGRLMAIRIELAGASEAHVGLVAHQSAWDTRLREAVVDRFGDAVWVEKVKFRTQAKTDPSSGDGAVEGLVEALRDEDSIREALADVEGELTELLALIPSDPRSGDPPIDPGDPAQFAKLVDDIRRVLVPRLLGKGGEA